MLLTGVDGVSCLYMFFLTSDASDRTEFAQFVYLKLHRSDKHSSIIIKINSTFALNFSISHINICVRLHIYFKLGHSTSKTVIDCLITYPT